MTHIFRLEVELEVSDSLIGTSPEEYTWVIDTLLMNEEGNETSELVLHSNELGDELGKVTVINWREVKDES